MEHRGDLQIRPIQRGDPVDQFVCTAAPALESFLRTRALRNEGERYGRTFVLSGTLEGREAILGYYTLVMHSAERTLLARSKRHNTPNSIGVALIGRLAVDDRARGQGYGGKLLVDALERIYRVSSDIGCYAAVVDAKDENAERFYQRFGFAEPTAGGYPRRMFLALETIAQTLGGEG